jgi:hypothetical protein
LHKEQKEDTKKHKPVVYVLEAIYEADFLSLGAASTMRWMPCLPVARPQSQVWTKAT